MHTKRKQSLKKKAIVSMAGPGGKRMVESVLKMMIEGGGFDRVINRVRVLSGGEGKCVAEMVVTKEDINKMGTLHGGMTATLVDCISSAALTSTGKGLPGVSVNLNITYLKGVQIGEEILIDARTLKSGKTLAFLDVLIKNKASGDVVATGSHTKFIGS